MTDYDILRPWNTLDPWQTEYINSTDTNCLCLCARQVGKSVACAIKMGKLAATKPNQSILIIAYTENQAYSLFFKCLMYLEACYPEMICKGSKKPTKHIIHIRNGSKIYCYAAGEQGTSCRGMTLTHLVIDEAASMSPQVAEALFPATSVVGGKIDLLSTPRGKGDDNFFYKCSLRADFKKFYVSAWDCPRHDKKFLETQQANMTKLAFAQEYEARFLDELKRVFSSELIERACRLKRPENIPPGNIYIGLDTARMGEDLSVFSVIVKHGKDKFHQIESIVTKQTRLTDTLQKLVELNAKYKPVKIYIDDGGCGSGILDFGLKIDALKRKLVPINNASRSLDKDESHNKKILKEDLYNNLILNLEQGYLALLEDDDIKHSLACMQYEYVTKEGEKTSLRIYGSGGFDHHAESLTRSAWGIRDKWLGIWVR